MALLAKIRPDEAEPEGCGGPTVEARMKYGRIFAATLRAGADFPDFVAARRWQTPGMRHSLLLELEKNRLPAPPPA
jgi:hypothetical protein